MIKFYCRACSKRIGVPDEHVGRKVKCPKCGTANSVPQASTPVDSPAESSSVAARQRDAAGGSVLLRELAELTDESGSSADALASLDDPAERSSTAAVDPDPDASHPRPPRRPAGGPARRDTPLSGSPIMEPTVTLADAIGVPAPPPDDPPVPPPSRPAPARHGPRARHTPDYPVLLYCGYAFFVIAALLAAAALVFFVVSLVAADRMPPMAVGPAAVTGLLGALLLAAYALVPLAFGALLHAVRDIARNSWKH